MNKKRIILALVLSFAVTLGFAQNSNDMRLNELMVYNTQDMTDDYGEHCGWIELFNSSYGAVNMGGCYFSNDPSNLMMNQIPKGDVKTLVQPRQTAVFFADGQGFRGTFHLNFKIEPGQEIFLVLGDGHTIVDRIKVPDQIDTNRSYGRITDGIGPINGDASYWKIQDHPSPGTTVYQEKFETKSQHMAKVDPYGWIMAITAMSVVFIALVILYLCFKEIGNISKKKMRKAAVKTPAGKAAAEADEKAVLSAETCAAIAMALELYKEENEAHDQESFVVTMQHTDRSYSPWSAKIYTLRQTPETNKKKR